MVEYLLTKARRVADSRGLDGAKLQISTRSGKRFAYLTNNGLIHFGAWPASTFLDHGDEAKRAAWRARHGKIMRGLKPAYMDENSPSYYAWRVLW